MSLLFSLSVVWIQQEDARGDDKKGSAYGIREQAVAAGFRQLVAVTVTVYR